MGGLQPTATNFDPEHQGWIMSQSEEGVTIWTNPTTNQQLEEYSFIVSNAEELFQEERAFNLRYDSQYLVAGRYFSNSSQNQVCATIHKGNIFIERIPLRLSKVNEIPFPDVLHMYQRAFRGFDILQQHVGPFDINEDMICFTTDGRVKVWLNSNLSRGLPQLRFDGSSATEAGMIRRLIDLIETNTYRQDIPANIKEFLHERNVRTFAEASAALQDYSHIYNVPIPSFMKCVIQTQRVLNSVDTNMSVKRETRVRDAPSLFETQPLKSQSPLVLSVSPEHIHRAQVRSHLSVKPSAQPAALSHLIIQNPRPLTSVLRPNISLNHLHTQQNIQTLPSEPLHTNVSSTPIRYLTNSQSLVNILGPVNQLHMARTPINNQNPVRMPVQSSINVTSPRRAVAALSEKLPSEKRTNSKFVPRHASAYKVGDNKAPLSFRAIAPKSKVSYQNTVSQHSINGFQERINVNSHVLNSQHVASNINITNRPTSTTVSSPNEIRKVVPNVQFASKPVNTINLKDRINAKYNPIRIEPTTNEFVLKTKQQFLQQRQKVSEVYRQIGPKSSYSPKKIMPTNQIAAQNPSRNGYAGFPMSSGANSNINTVNARPIASAQEITHRPQLQKTHNVAQLVTQNANTQSVDASIHNPPVPMSFSSKYFSPSSKYTAQAFTYRSYTNPETQPVAFSKDTYLYYAQSSSGGLQAQSAQTQQEANRGVIWSFGSSEFYNTGAIRQENESINSSRQNFGKNVESELMQDLRRLRMNAAEQSSAHLR